MKHPAPFPAAIRLGAAALFAVLIAVSAAGCGPKVEEYYPLELGNLWEYKTTYPDGRSRTDLEQIIRRQERSYYFSNGEVIIKLSRNTLINRNGLQILKAPFEKGREWEDETVSFRITSVGETVEVPAGTFTDTVTVEWTMQRRAPVTLTADEYADSLVPADERRPKPPPEVLKDKPKREMPLRDFKTYMTFAKGIGPIRYRLEAAEEGEPLREILVSDLVEYKFPNR
ncbi:MAG: hypothetical protein H6684_12600 [Deltaproteobacteria bacterium]|nr:hypothetical protein [bacterium]MCB9476884.1 hypothetical protein [Deltaproteobacteria bacterium]MCB9480045.1 hypothetical protein [Deltaproteobacteria bacterium]MCB9489564.1 hypothetical protein [Deltaproteobacteria bacterium]